MSVLILPTITIGALYAMRNKKNPMNKSKCDSFIGRRSDSFVNRRKMMPREAEMTDEELKQSAAFVDNDINKWRNHVL
jgi:hypothetical protein